MDEGEDLETLDITACKEKIGQLQAERERRREYTERLQEKLKALNNELAARKEEKERNEDYLKHEQTLNKENAEKRREQGGDAKQQDKVDKVRRYIEEMLHAKAPKEERTKDGFRSFDETDLMVDKPLEEQAKEQTYIDTVLVTHAVPNTDLKYQLTYRVDKKTTSQKLRKDACLFWGISEVDYILKTPEHSKVHDDVTIQACFKPNELAHLVLTQKTPKNTTINPEEDKATAPKIGPGRRTKKADATGEDPGAGRVRGKTARFDEQLRVVPGLYEFMTQRDEGVRDHCERIRPRNMYIYKAFAVITMIALTMTGRPPGEEFLVRQGSVLLMTGAMQKPGGPLAGRTESFLDIKTKEHAWDWLEYVIPAQLLNNQSSLRRYFYPPGHMRVRMQIVHMASAGEDPSLHCLQKKAVPAGVRCIPNVHSLETQALADFTELKAYWLGDGTQTWGPANQSNDTHMYNETTMGLGRRKGRSGRQPWKYTTSLEEAASNSGVGTEAGLVQRYDASGFSTDFNLQWPNLVEMTGAYLQDLKMMKSLSWISTSTRAIHVSFTLYNGNYDWWLSNRYTLEMPANSLVVPSLEVRPFRVGSPETDPEKSVATLDIVRTCFALYIGFFQIYWEIKYERKQEEGSMWYYVLGPAFLADFTIGVVFLYIMVMKYVMYGMLGASSAEFHDEQKIGFMDNQSFSYGSEQILLSEAILMTAIVYRIMSFWKINRHFFIIWTTIGEAFRRFWKFALMFIPIGCGFVMLAHSIWGPYVAVFIDYSSSFSSLMMMVSGDLRPDILYNSQRPWTAIFSILFYVVVVFILINGWIAVLIHVYQQVRTTSGYDPQTYKWKEWQYLHWFVWSWPAFLRKSYFKYLRPKIEKPKTKGEDDEDE